MKVKNGDKQKHMFTSDSFFFIKLQTKFKNLQTLIIKEKVAFDYFDVVCEVTRYIFIFLMFSENDHTNQRKSINK